MTDRFKCPWCSQHFRANPGDHVHCPKCRTLLDTSQIPRVAEPTPPPVALTPPSQNPASTAIPPKRPTFLDGWKKLIDPLVDQTKRILEERQQNVERRQQAEAERIARAKAEAERIAKVRADAYAKLEVWKRENPERAAAIAARKAIASSENEYYWHLWYRNNPHTTDEEFFAFAEELQLFFEWRAWKHPSKEAVEEALGQLLTGTTKKPTRKPIPPDVKDDVWRRDQGRCAQCGSNENLEFDHIIPLSKGGANTYRNLQLLCEPCNRSKSDRI